MDWGESTGPQEGQDIPAGSWIVLGVLLSFRPPTVVACCSHLRVTIGNLIRPLTTLGPCRWAASTIKKPRLSRSFVCQYMSRRRDGVVDFVFKIPLESRWLACQPATRLRRARSRRNKNRRGRELIEMSGPYQFPPVRLDSWIRNFDREKCFFFVHLWPPHFYRFYLKCSIYSISMGLPGYPPACIWISTAVNIKRELDTRSTRMNVFQSARLCLGPRVLELIASFPMRFVCPSLKIESGSADWPFASIISKPSIHSFIHKLP